MLFNQEKIHTMGQEFQKKADNFMSLVEHGQKTEEQFLNVKLAFTAFVGVLFAVVFDKIEFFEKQFLVILLCIVVLIFIFLIYDFWCAMCDLETASKNQHRRVLLAKIRHIAAMESDKKTLNHYGHDAETMLINNEEVRQKMFEGKPIEEIIKYPKDEGVWKLHFILWAVLFLSVPILFLLKMVNVL